MESLYAEPPSVEVTSSRNKNLKAVLACAGAMLVAMAVQPHEASANPDPQTPITETARDPMVVPKDNPNCSWITDKPSGHYIGYTCKGDRFEKLATSPSGEYVAGVVTRDGREICGWINPGIIRAEIPRSAHKSCKRLLKKMKSRDEVGEAYNCGLKNLNGKVKSKCVDGRRNTSLTTGCDYKFYRNFASSRKSQLNLRPNSNSGFYDYVGIEKGPVVYRYTSNRDSKDGRAIIIRSLQYGWGYMQRICVSGTPRGGTPNTSSTVHGASPNAERRP
jgi:hypothetical protein